MGTLAIKNEDLEGNIFVNGLRHCANVSNNYHKRRDFGKLARAVERAARAVSEDRADMIRAYKTGEVKGKPEVDHSAMTPDKAVAWKSEDEKWRNGVITVESDLVIDGKIKFDLPQAEADRFPSVCLEFMDPYIEITINDKKENDALKERVANLEAALAAAGKGSE
jgi:hypothetical protein